MKSANIQAVVYRFLRRALPCVSLVLVSLVAVTLAGCGALRFPGQTPEPTNPHVILINTPTLAPMLLTPAATCTPVPTSSSTLEKPTPTFGLPLPEPTCLTTPMWGLGDVWGNENVRRRLGCPIGEQVGIEGEEVYFQNGHMLWRPDASLIYVLFDPAQAKGWGAFADTFQPSDPERDPNIVEPTPEAGMQLYVQPTGRFGKLWRENAWLRHALGWAVIQHIEGQTTTTVHFHGAVQDFEHGVLFWNGKICFVLRTDDMSWVMY